MNAPVRFDVNDATWLAHRFVESSEAFRFIAVDRQRHATAPFLTDEYLAHCPIGADVPLATCASLPPVAPGLLFHSAFCGSTMLTRALDLPGLSMGLSEPVVLNDVVGWRRRGAPQDRVAAALDVALRLLARPFGDGEQVVIKPSNIVNSLAGPIMALRPEARAIFLYAPLESFLISVARKGLGCRLWARELLEGQLRDGYVDLGFSSGDYFRQTDLQVAAVGWLAQHMAFRRLATRLGGDRLRALDADKLATDPSAAIRAAVAHYGLPATDAQIARILAGPALTRHSKSGVAYSGEQRRIDYAEAKSAHGDEIDKVLVWTETVAQGVGVDLGPPMTMLV